jgi:hypothetical protein
MTTTASPPVTTTAPPLPTTGPCPPTSATGVRARKRQVAEGVDHCVILSNGALSPGPWLADKNDAMIGTGGCFAVALASLSILGGSKDEVCAKLDAQIDRQCVEFNEQRARNGQVLHDRARAGVEGVQWSPEVIRRALREERVERRATCPMLRTTFRACLRTPPPTHVCYAS